VLEALKVALLLLLATDAVGTCTGSFPAVLLTEEVLLVLEIIELFSTDVILLERDPPSTELLTEAVFNELVTILVLLLASEVFVFSRLLSSTELGVGVVSEELAAVLLPLLSTVMPAELVLEAPVTALLSLSATGIVVSSTDASSTERLTEDVFGELEIELMMLLALKAVVSSKGPPANFSLTNLEILGSAPPPQAAKVKRASGDRL
jgi:hypothetical protein